MKYNDLFDGLTSDKVRELQLKYGKNIIVTESKQNFFLKICHIITEPMFLLLIIAAIIYFFLGDAGNGITMLVFVVGIISIDIIQEWRTDKALAALKKLSAPQITVIRDKKEQLIVSEDLVPGDIMLISEGIKIPADGKVLKSSTLSVDESILTGESGTVWKDVKEDTTNNYWHSNYCYAGTLVTRGSGAILVEKIGIETEYGKIGANIMKAPEKRTLLQNQIKQLIKFSAFLAVVLFALVVIITYFNLSGYEFSVRITESILSGITLAMAMIPEEFPVILTVFLSIGAWRLARKHSLVKNLPAVETLGAISVLCVDKTGTITTNKMKINDMWDKNNNEKELLLTMGMGCKIDTYDPMEKAMIAYCNEKDVSNASIFENELIKEYPFTDELKIMGHVLRREEKVFISAKGSPESLLKICNLTKEEKETYETKSREMSEKGLRIIAIGSMTVDNEEEIPENLIDCKLNLCGIVGLIDPPRDSIKQDIKKCIDAGIQVVMITGDNGITASAIAKQIGMPNSDNVITGDELSKISDEELREKIKDINIFSRVIPEQKMRIVNAFKENGKVVAMTGDGVNDAPALKYADIGIAMGKHGSEVARETAKLILMDDNFSTIVDTIEDGRRIYDNIKKAIEYVFTIHIPIALSSLIAPLLGIGADNLLLLPLHIVLLELMIDPTCSIILEKQPAEDNVMRRPPRSKDEKIFSVKALFKNLIQGTIIFIATFGTYYFVLKQNPDDILIARTMGLSILLLANLLLVQVNSSNTKLAISTLKYYIKDKTFLFINLITLSLILIIIFTPINSFLKLTSLSFYQFLIVILIAVVSVLWYEIVKVYKNNKTKRTI